MVPADAARCAELETILFPGDGPWPEDAFRDELRTPHVRYRVVRDDDGGVLGYAGIALLGTGSGAEAEIHTIGVDPAAQGRGIGRALLADALAAADAHGGPVFLEVRTDNDAALGLYRSSGFAIVGTRRGYYRPSGADAYTMRREPGGRPTTEGSDS
ncbi:ribosomal protein S18-alanine N-acetyltransferase [Rhodococcoides corynebacterioides]|uniref:Ribosomal protein S18-alanine N-acetyltransferase n=1 Tax=Rhodococcoides corynebacterioides TaxID=53972 RepID=A0ABS7P031_9NOCA|nr:ribosomal protein S18-alanine N-acetyltransferase [Rhodococcus corynebacterioides]MBY6365738.1 ribosomal protein S18-alanine N-acetyltransferase [Rhodococcus corynebacterioides]MBY6406469.1 ribosomal protein S18-alanine N-acetyltransferase [Rhodococcus corynebacterioides]